LTYLFIAFIPTIVGGILFTYYINEEVKKEYTNAVENNLIQIDYSIERMLNLCRQVTKIISVDNGIIGILQSSNLADSALIKTIAYEIVPKLQGIKEQNEYIYKLKVIHGNPKIPVIYDTLYYDERINSGYWSNKLKMMRNKNFNEYDEIFIETTHEEEVFPDLQDTGKNKVFTVYRPIYSVYTYKVIAIVGLDILESVFLDSLKSQILNKGEVINLINRDGLVLFSNEKNVKITSTKEIEKTNNFTIMSLNGEKYYIVKRYIKNIESYIILYIPENLLSGSNKYKLLICVVLIACFITLSVVSFLMSKIIMRRLMKLTDAVNEIKLGNLKTKVNIKSNDEIGKLAENFNEMVDKINELMLDIENLNKAEKDAMYKALENQIKPHFLCNALDMIRMRAEIQGNYEISHAAELIASYFTYNIERRSKYVSIRDELKNVIDYIEIHNIVSNNKIQYKISISSEIDGYLDEYKILKFILQPIIENSIKHGFKGRKEDSNIFINIMYVGDIVISVEDNGDGINAERMKEINACLDTNTGIVNSDTLTSNIGLRNIKERLVINYGENYGLEIESYPGIGTCVTVKTPLIKHITE